MSTGSLLQVISNRQWPRTLCWRREGVKLGSVEGSFVGQPLLQVIDSGPGLYVGGGRVSLFTGLDYWLDDQFDPI